MALPIDKETGREDTPATQGVSVEEKEALVMQPEEGAENGSGDSLQTSSPGAEVLNPLTVLEEMGITNLKIDWTSFPTVVIANETFNKDFTDRIEFTYLNKRKQYLYTGQKMKDGRTEGDPEMVYSDDAVIANLDGRKMSEVVQEWKDLGYSLDRTEYIIMVVLVKNTEYAGKILQLQLPPTSHGVLGGHLFNMGMDGSNPREVPTTATVGETVGKGLRAFNPWVFTF
jgi:hypothetical protein